MSYTTHAKRMYVGTKAERTTFTTADLAHGEFWLQLSGDAEDPSLYTWTGAAWIRFAGTLHTRIGELTSTITGAGYGRRLYLSGGGSVDGTYDSDNSDPLWFARYNVATDESELRVNIGDNGAATDGFVIGYTDTLGVWHELFRMNADGSTSGFGAGGAHNLLSATHSDTTADGPVQGDVIVADATPKWVRKAKGTAHQLFKMDATGTAPEWDTFDWDDLSGTGDMVHTHADAAEGGQLDWDDVWSDAAHDHTDAANGGQFARFLGGQFADVTTDDPVQGDLIVGDVGPTWTKLAVGGAYAFLQVDSSGSYPEWTSFDWDLQAAGADMVHDHSSAAEGGGAGVDLFPNADGRGLAARLINPPGLTSWTAHFRSGETTGPGNGTLTGYSWQGAPLGGTPGTVNYSYANDYLQMVGSTSTKYFLSKAITNAAASWQNKVLQFRATTGSQTEIGVRLDNGSTEYVELYVTGTLANATIRVDFRYSDAGGSGTVSSGLIVPAGTMLTLYLLCFHSAGTYTAYGYVIGETGSEVNITGFSRTLTGNWTSGPPVAGRSGVFTNLSTTAGNPGFIDWFRNTFT
jgi:hypothetical protein